MSDLAALVRGEASRNSPPYKSEKLAKSCTFVATSAEQAELFRVVREGHPILESRIHLLDIADRDTTGRKTAFLVKWKKACVSMETRPRSRKRLSERIPESLSVLAFLVAGDSPSLAACVFSIWGRVSGTEFKIELKSFVWRPSEQIDFFANVSATPARLHLYLFCL